MPHQCDASCNYFICSMHTWGHSNVHLVYTRAVLFYLTFSFITWTLVLLQLMTSVSLHPKVNAGFLTPGLMGLYVVFLCWCAIRSEPAGESCNRKAEASRRTDWLTIISFIVALLAIVIATFSTGIDSQCFQVSPKIQ
ncbi:serine incorporator [Populus alba x Populus x berolinensis]|nr:serine incorporator [Populus alba x Populus x berolinensis]